MEVYLFCVPPNSVRHPDFFLDTLGLKTSKSILFGRKLKGLGDLELTGAFETQHYGQSKCQGAPRSCIFKTTETICITKDISHR